MEIKKGMRLGFCESEPGSEPDSFAEVVRIDPDGSCALYFPAAGNPVAKILDYASGVIQGGIEDGEIIIMEGGGDAHGTAP